MCTKHRWKGNSEQRFKPAEEQTRNLMKDEARDWDRLWYDQIYYDAIDAYDNCEEICCNVKENDNGE
jgi:hypothetical protein